MLCWSGSKGVRVRLIDWALYLYYKGDENGHLFAYSKSVGTGMYAFDVISAITFQRRYGFMGQTCDVDDMISKIDTGLQYELSAAEFATGYIGPVHEGEDAALVARRCFVFDNDPTASTKTESPVPDTAMNSKSYEERPLCSKIPETTSEIALERWIFKSHKPGQLFKSTTLLFR
ncbi:hypothetical protein DPV78_001830 [Talaromyces pinophilus]|nr:hypothetical protein DPV78_001830 [Talaromyces pinophilus]